MAIKSILFFIVLSIVNVECRGKEDTFHLDPSHVSYSWRLAAGFEKPTFQKYILWTRHEQVGIGNALGGFTRVLEDAMIEDRELIIKSYILQKFCEILECSISSFEYEQGKDDDMRKASHFQIQMRTPKKLNLDNPEDMALSKIEEAADCTTPPDHMNTLNDHSWPQKCLYSKIIRSVIKSNDGRLKDEKEWIRRFYVGDSTRFDTVMEVNKKENFHVFDVTIHIRTLGLIEDLSTEDGVPENLEEKTKKFLRSEGFKSMVNCFASNIVEGITEDRGKSGVLSVYLATDAGGIREKFATRLIEATEKILKMKGNNMKVEVDYFKATLPPAHFFIWTYPINDMKLDDWQRLAGTTAEWLFLSQGKKMLTVKGLAGGERAMTSSFALSAAAFGQVRDLLFLYTSEGKCRWDLIASFM